MTDSIDQCTETMEAFDLADNFVAYIFKKCEEDNKEYAYPRALGCLQGHLRSFLLHLEHYHIEAFKDIHNKILYKINKG